MLKAACAGGEIGASRVCAPILLDQRFLKGSNLGPVPFNQDMHLAKPFTMRYSKPAATITTRIEVPAARGSASSRSNVKHWRSSCVPRDLGLRVSQGLVEGTVADNISHRHKPAHLAFMQRPGR